MSIYFADIVEAPHKIIWPLKYAWNKATDHNKRLRSLWNKMSGNNLLYERGLSHKNDDNGLTVLGGGLIGPLLGAWLAVGTMTVINPDASDKAILITMIPAMVLSAFAGAAGLTYFKNRYIASKHDKDAQQMRREKGSFPQNTR